MNNILVDYVVWVNRKDSNSYAVCDSCVTEILKKRGGVGGNDYEYAYSERQMTSLQQEYNSIQSITINLIYKA
jgi:hypothetical protein